MWPFLGRRYSFVVVVVVFFFVLFITFGTIQLYFNIIRENAFSFTPSGNESLRRRETFVRHARIKLI